MKWRLQVLRSLPLKSFELEQVADSCNEQCFIWRNSIVLNETCPNNLVQISRSDFNIQFLYLRRQTMNRLRRLSLMAATVLLASAAWSQSYPSKAIRVVVPFPPGGGTDIIAREITQKVSANTGWSLVIENKPGAGGNLGIDAVAKAAPDGYTIGLGQSSNLAVNPTLYAKMPYDSVKDLSPIGVVASAPLLIAVATDSPMKTFGDLVRESKAKPGAINFAYSGNGTVAHLSGVMLQNQAGIKWTLVPYRGAAQAATDLIGGQVQMYISSVPTLIGHVKGGKMRALAITSAKRGDDLPDVPTVAESGVRGFEAATWFGFVAPAGTPPEIVNRLNAEIAKALQAADVRKKLSDQGADLMSGSPEQFGQLIKTDIARWAPVVKESGAKAD
jgi:tripartite-type tricarboxylate transporter receptor subunit TctC